MEVIPKLYRPLGQWTPINDLLCLSRLAEDVARRFPNGHAVEIGSYAGRTALVLAEYPLTVHCIDAWDDAVQDDTAEIARDYGGRQRVFETFCENVGQALNTRVYPYQGMSVDVAKTWTKPIHLLFIDGDHSFEGVKADYEAWAPFVVDGGIICGHDLYVCDGVTQFVDELKASGVPVQHRGFCMWWFRK